MRQSGPARIICSLAFAAALFLLISAVSRYLMLQAFAPDDLAKLTGAEKYDVFRTGTLYDIRAFTLTFAPFLLVMILGSAFRSPRTVGIAFRTGGVFTAFVLIVFSVINFYFYRTYNSYIDVFIFSAFDEDAEAVMKTVVHDYPLGGLSLRQPSGFSSLYTSSGRRTRCSPERGFPGTPGRHGERPWRESWC